MTLPNERYRAVNKAREFLRSLLDPKKTPRVPSQVRKEAYWVLKHFPGEHDMSQVARKVPSVFEDPSNGFGELEELLDKSVQNELHRWKK